MKLIVRIFMAAVVLFLAACDSKVDPLLITADDYCDVNAPRGEVDKKEEIMAWGWAFDKSNATIPEEVILQIISEDKVNGMRIPLNRDSRPDLAKAFNLPIEMGGFKTNIDLKTLPAGVYSVSVVQRTKGRVLLCNSNFKVVLK